MLARLERIATLERQHAPLGALIAEVRTLLDEADAWASAEREAPDSVLEALMRCRELLENESRTLLA